MEQATLIFKDESKTQLSKEIIAKEDSDSGLDNNSDSGSGWDEEPTRSSSSESDDASQIPTRPERKKKKKKKVKLFDEETIDSRDKIDVETVSDRLSETVFMKKCDHVESTSQQDEEEINLEGIPEFFRELAKGRLEAVEFITTVRPKPDWLDEEKFKRGQQFAASNLFGLNFAEMLSLLMLFAPKSVLKPLIFTGKSDTPFKAFRRYLSTVLKLKSWYETDLWSDEESEGRKNIIIVNNMHKNVYTKLTSLSPEEIEERATLGDPTTTAMWCPMRDIIVEDFRNSCPMSSFKSNPEKKVWLSQLDMSITQFGFVGLAVTFPDYFGLHHATEDDLDSFCHLWRGLGYLMGVQDKYNFCNADLETVRQRTRDFIELAVKPSFREVTEEWEHMCRCMVRGIAFYIPIVEFEPALLYLCYTIGVEMPRLKKAITFTHYIKFQTHRFVNYIQRSPVVVARLNKRLNEFIKKAQEASPEVLAQWEATEFSYSKQPGKRPIRN